VDGPGAGADSNADSDEEWKAGEVRGQTESGIDYDLEVCVSCVICGLCHACVLRVARML
jgi:hypothetical protein